MIWLLLFFAVALCGAVIVPMNARYKHNELAYVIENFHN